MRVVSPMNRFLTRSSRVQSEDQGAVAIIVALLLIVLIGFGAFAVDMGYAYAVKRNQSVTADAAALAGAQAAATRFRQLHSSGGVGCTPSTAGEVSGAATTAAVETYNANAPQGSAGAPTVTVSCDSGNFNVTVHGESSLPTFLGGLLGQSELRPAAEATAQVAGAPAYGGLRPYAICQNDVEAASTNSTSQAEFFNKGGTKSCKGPTPGNWGLVDFNGGSNKVPELADWTANGYPDAISFPQDDLPGNPGEKFNSSQVKDALDSIVGQTVLFPVASKWAEGGGSNASFTAVGAVQAKVCGYAIKGKKQTTDSTCWNDTLFKSASSAADLVIQWRYVAFPISYSPGTSAGTNCSLSSSACIPTIRLWR